MAGKIQRKKAKKRMFLVESISFFRKKNADSLLVEGGSTVYPIMYFLVKTGINDRQNEIESMSATGKKRVSCTLDDPAGYPGRRGQRSSRNFTSSMLSEDNASVDSSTRSLNSARLRS